MNLDTLEIGQKFEKEYIVKQEHTADALGNIGIKVLSTPFMICFMEETASQIVWDILPRNFRPVGTKINVSHIKATPIGMKVIVKATLISIDGRKLTYDVEAYYNEDKIGFGTYEQHVINMEEFLGK